MRFTRGRGGDEEGKGRSKRRRGVGKGLEWNGIGWEDHHLDQRRVTSSSGYQPHGQSEDSNLAVDHQRLLHGVNGDVRRREKFSEGSIDIRQFTRVNELVERRSSEGMPGKRSEKQRENDSDSGR